MGDTQQFCERVTGPEGADGTFAGQLTCMAVQDIAGQLTGIVVHVHPDQDLYNAPQAAVDQRRLLDLIDAQVLEGVAGGASTVQLASQLFLSRQGIEYHLQRMLRQLGAPNRAALVARAYAMGLLTLSAWPPRVLPKYIR
jgi:DNA-binding CsgD family transcriptional regulator